eukprot:CAMPEP_0170627694 /NCGR_PEP_ID=MMETSP0224-20130122/32135_1 /TAXON_ID=285029 /ORGANISM="Togula jolla, Strain CCCM 725" /LENGTH=107 /DNA_ID=CAMNT_0010954765 /DNA_START=103 /DNA_END=422 /DNA_ORIENTATION=+
MTVRNLLQRRTTASSLERWPKLLQGLQTRGEANAFGPADRAPWRHALKSLAFEHEVVLLGGAALTACSTRPPSSSLRHRQCSNTVVGVVFRRTLFTRRHALLEALGS